MTVDVTMERLENQIDWYHKRSRTNQSLYKSLKIAVIVAAAMIPLLSGTQLPLAAPSGVPSWVLGALGATIAVIEGIQQVNQYHANWLSYRSTCEALKHEKYLYLAKAGPYATAVAAHGLLAERIESLVSQEHTKWASSQDNVERTMAQPGGKQGG
jgi:Protein of unknown function (DUF4231)